jgi:hypothetical protein
MRRTLIAFLFVVLMVPAMALAARPKPQGDDRVGPGTVVFHPLYERSRVWRTGEPQPKYSGPELFAVPKAEGKKVEASIRKQLGLKRDDQVVLFGQGFNTKGLTESGMTLNYRFAVIPGVSGKDQPASGGVVSMGITLQKKGRKADRTWPWSKKGRQVWDGIVNTKSIGLERATTAEITNLKPAPPDEYLYVVGSPVK